MDNLCYKDFYQEFKESIFQKICKILEISEEDIVKNTKEIKNKNFNEGKKPLFIDFTWNYTKDLGRQREEYSNIFLNNNSNNIILRETKIYNKKCYLLNKITELYNICNIGYIIKESDNSASKKQEKIKNYQKSIQSASEKLSEISLSHNKFFDMKENLKDILLKLQRAGNTDKFTKSVIKNHYGQSMVDQYPLHYEFDKKLYDFISLGNWLNDVMEIGCEEYDKLKNPQRGKKENKNLNQFFIGLSNIYYEITEKEPKCNKICQKDDLYQARSNRYEIDETFKNFINLIYKNYNIGCINDDRIYELLKSPPNYDDGKIIDIIKPIWK